MVDTGGREEELLELEAPPGASTGLLGGGPDTVSVLPPALTLGPAGNLMPAGACTC